MFRTHFFSLRRLNGRIFWAFVGLASLMLATGIGANFLVSSAENSNQQQVFRLRQVADVRTLRGYVTEQLNSLNLITAYKVPNVLEFIGVNSFIRTTVTLQEMSRDFPDGDEAAGSFNLIQNSYGDISRQVNANLGKTRTAAEEANLYSQIKSNLEKVDAEVAALVQDREKAADNSRDNYHIVLDNTRWTYLVVSFVLFMLALFFAGLISRLIAIPLSILVSYLRQIAVGNLAKQMSPQGADEVVELSLIFNRTILNLKLAIARIIAQVSAINSTSQQIIQSSNTQAASMTEQSVAVAQASVTLAELSDTSQQIASSATLAANSANEALNSATECYDMLLGANETMREVRLKVNTIAEHNMALNKIAQRIREITLLIDNFSNETHLLALNAALESASAGVEGARFAVVAGHVRRLAQRSRVAAVDIQELVTKIQQAAARSVMVTEEGIKVVALGEKMVSDSLQANGNIINRISQTTQLAEAISQATQHQEVATTQVADNMRQLSEISHTISQHSQQYLAGANSLGEVVNQLEAVVNAFVIEETPRTEPSSGPEKPVNYEPNQQKNHALSSISPTSSFY
jgi:methyl-accepting chemotaxis protein